MSLIDDLIRYPIGKKRYLNEFNSTDAKLNVAEYSTVDNTIYRYEIRVGCNIIVPEITSKSAISSPSPEDIAIAKIKRELYRDIGPIVYELSHRIYERDWDSCTNLIKQLEKEIQ